MSVGNLYGHMDHHNMLLDIECKRLKKIMDKLSIGDNIKFYNNEYEIVEGKITKIYNWYQIEVTEDCSKRWGISVGSLIKEDKE